MIRKQGEMLGKRHNVLILSGYYFFYPFMTEVILYTDGAASGNPGPGGFGVVLRSGIHRKELSMGFRKTTNNRMELLGVIVGLEAWKSRYGSYRLFGFPLCGGCSGKKMGF